MSDGSICYCHICRPPTSKPNDHPELDLSPELDEDGIAKYQSLIGSLQWAVSLGRLDITTAVMTMSEEHSSFLAKKQVVARFR